MSVVPYTPRSWVEMMVPAAELAKQIAGTEFVPKSLRNNPGAIAAAILFGDEVGFGPMQSLAKIAVIEGKPALAAEAQRALILRAGHDIWIEDASVTKVTVCGRRKDSEQINRFTWTMDDAKRANLAGRPSWRMYPRQMLTARATAELARAVFADAIGGLMAIEELEESGEGVGGSSPDNGAEGTTRRTRRRSKTALTPAVSSGPDLEDTPVQPGPPLPGELADETGAPGADTAITASPDVESEPQLLDEPDKPTARQFKNLNRLVGTLRDQGHISTENLWSAVANMRSVDVTTMIDLAEDAYTPDGTLHWSPLRESLTRDEASNLIDRLQRLEEHIGGTPEL